MSGSDKLSPRYVVICVADEPSCLDALVRDVGRVCRPEFDVEACSDPQRVLEIADALRPPHERVALVIADHHMPTLSGVELLLALHDKHNGHATRKVLLDADVSREDLIRLLGHGALHRTLSNPWTPEALQECLTSLLTSYLSHHAPEDMPRFSRLVDLEQRPRAQKEADQTRKTLSLQVRTLESSFLANMDMSDEEVERAMGAGIDEALDSPPRRDHPAGSVLLRQDQPVESVSIVVSGEVQLLRRAGEHEVVFHTDSTGRIIGLLALAHRQVAFYTCRALTDVTVIPLTLPQLDTALHANPWLGSYFTTVLLRSMARRAKRTAQLKIEIEQLNHELRGERDQLADALTQLENAHMRLVESEKMAVLGQLSAGMAHELNNPIAAIQRTADFLREDLVALLDELPEHEASVASVLSAIEREPLSTRRERQYRTSMAERVGDAGLAQRLIHVGVTTPETYQSFLGKLAPADRDRRLEEMERFSRLGSSLRSLSTCSRRIADIVKSLRSYARADEAPVAHVDPHQGLEDTLLLFGHAMEHVEAVRDYGDLPTIECHPSQIGQVWTNVISNALDAMDKRGTLRIETDLPDPDHVRVRITDSGRGVPPDQLARAFELNFTTKRGQAGFGLGMGLAICRQIITRHGGTIEMDSRPGCTCVTVVLPTRYPRGPREGRES